MAKKSLINKSQAVPKFKVRGYHRCEICGRPTFDPSKRAETLRTRNVDFLDAAKVFEELAFTFRDERLEYAEPRYVTAGMLEGRMVIVVWTPDEENERAASSR